MYLWLATRDSNIILNHLNSVVTCTCMYYHLFYTHSRNHRRKPASSYCFQFTHFYLAHLPVWCYRLQVFQKMKYQVSVSEDLLTDFHHPAAQQNAWYAAWVHLYSSLPSEIFLLVLLHLKVDLNHFQFLLSSSWLLRWTANKTVTYM